MKISRRTFLMTGAAGFGSLLLMPSCFRRAHGPFLFFSTAEACCIIAMAEQIIPADQYGGGATEAGVIHYIDRQLVAVFSEDQVTYQWGIEAMQRSCMKLYNTSFERLETKRKIEFLTALESGKQAGPHWEKIDPRRFFTMVRNHTMQGFYGAPRHGGNKDYLSYQMMDIGFPLMVGRNKYKDQEQ